MSREISRGELKDIQLDILRKVHKFCIDHGIKYSITAGTLLGAVRHHGYIPWDDDIDICMLRQDYNIFIKQFHLDPPKDLKLLSLETDKDYCYLFAKVEDTRTVLHEDHLVAGFDIGVNIDVFPYDDLPPVQNCSITRALCRRFLASFLWRFAIISVAVQIGTSARLFPAGFGVLKTIAKKMRNVVYSIISYRFALRIADRYFKKQYRDATYLVEWFWADNWSKCYRKNILEKVVPMEFEGEMFCAMSGWNEYLCAIYGDYMTPPPEGKSRESTHNFIAWWKDECDIGLNQTLEDGQ